MMGFLNIDKPAGYTSFDCVAIVRRQSGVRKVGHTGTLDPMATGVLPICIGGATRLLEYLEEDQKEYRCRMQLGMETDTDDVTGRVIATGDVSGLTEEKIRRAFSSFQGEIQQLPPRYAAIKVDGKKLYEYARQGKDVMPAPRQVTIHRLCIDDIHPGKTDEAETAHVDFTVRCSRGTYVRSICRDVGKALGCGGTMASLERRASGMFSIDSAISIEEIKELEPDGIADLLVPPDMPLGFMGRIDLDRARAQDLQNGKWIRTDESDLREPTTRKGYGKDRKGNRVPVEHYRIYGEGLFLGIGHRQGDGTLHGSKMLPERG